MFDFDEVYLDIWGIDLFNRLNELKEQDLTDYDIEENIDMNNCKTKICGVQFFITWE